MDQSVQNLAKEIEWLKEVTIHQGEKLTEVEIRLNKKHEEIIEIKKEESKKHEREMQFLENMTKTSTLLNRVADTLDNTQREIAKIKEDLDSLKTDNANRQGSVNTTRYLIGLFFTVFGGVVTLILTSLFRGL